MRKQGEGECKLPIAGNSLLQELLSFFQFCSRLAGIGEKIRART